jgi:hypothetical protein
MNIKIGKKWVESLRNGEYTQTTENLRSTEGYCVMGVLCDLHYKETAEGWWNYDENENYTYETFTGEEEKYFIPLEVMNWAELKNINPRFTEYVDKTKYSEAELSEKTHLVSLNDKNTSFNELADIIEKYMEIL